MCACDAQRYTKRTLKYSLGLASGAVLVTPLWLRACRAANCWKEPREEEHLVKGCVLHAIAHAGPAQRRQCPDKVFVGFSFYLSGEFTAPNPSRAELQLLLRIAGATGSNSLKYSA